ncbi:hypothetical protein vseg_012848 [Gypsophila vaccaria]
MVYHKAVGNKLQKLSMNLSSLPPPPPPLQQQPPRGTWSSHTRREIERFWRTKRLVEEDHLLHALKAAARPKAIHLSKEECRLFLKTLEDEVSNQEIRVNIKDWWTKSKYAYLN